MRSNNPYKKRIVGLMVLCCGLLDSCHQDPAIPPSLIPFTCQIGLVDAYDGPSRSLYGYQYDTFGNLIGRKDTINGASTGRTFKFDANQFPVSAQINGVAYTYTFDANKMISRISGGSITNDYTYDGTNLKTLVVKNGSSTSTYEFSNGQLSKLTPATDETVDINTQGKITKRTAGNTVTTYLYDGDGQLTQTETTSSATGERTTKLFTYDGKAYYKDASLLVRGVPVLKTGSKIDGQPGIDDFMAGDPGLHNNYKTIITSYRKSTTAPVSNDTLIYRHQYNAVGYSTGYLRSDGARTKYYYTNCP